jgi:hypothetical protein
MKRLHYESIRIDEVRKDTNVEKDKVQEQLKSIED